MPRWERDEWPTRTRDCRPTAIRRLQDALPRGAAPGLLAISPPSPGRSATSRRCCARGWWCSEAVVISERGHDCIAAVIAILRGTALPDADGAHNAAVNERQLPFAAARRAQCILHVRGRHIVGRLLLRPSRVCRRQSAGAQPERQCLLVLDGVRVEAPNMPINLVTLCIRVS